ncbi:T9SS type A sorting domain-containing protein [Ulvibacter litoralis]|nr:T9SS type A sorting domain-containing protein [Ulvibacter litoralis]
MKYLLSLCCLLFSCTLMAQDLSEGYIANDLAPHPQQPLDMPDYLESATDPSFPSTEIRRISDVNGTTIRVPMYSTIQAWNADESLLLIYGNGQHHLLNGTDYTFIRELTDITPDDIETVFWHFNDPDILFYLDDSTKDFIRYNVIDQSKTILTNLLTVSGCTNGVSMGNDVQMMSWDSDVFSFRCGNDTAYYYRISTETLTQFNISDLEFTAPMPFPSGNLFVHQGNIYDGNGTLVRTLNIDNPGEHSCLGRLSNGDDAYFAIAFEEGPNGNCQGTIVAHNAVTGVCFAVTPTSDYGYPQSGTHISSLAHKNNEGGWIAASMMGYDLDGQDLLDQEIIIAKVNNGNADVYRVAHHRADEEEYNYFGEPHVTISPTGTRLLFGSDWSGAEDGESLNSYVAELKAYDPTLSISEVSNTMQIVLSPNPVTTFLKISGNNPIEEYAIYAVTGEKVINTSIDANQQIDVSEVAQGVYFIKLSIANETVIRKFIKN